MPAFITFNGTQNRNGFYKSCDKTDIAVSKRKSADEKGTAPEITLILNNRKWSELQGL